MDLTAISEKIKAIETLLNDQNEKMNIQLEEIKKNKEELTQLQDEINKIEEKIKKTISILNGVNTVPQIYLSPVAEDDEEGQALANFAKTCQPDIAKISSMVFRDDFGKDDDDEEESG